MRSNSCSVSLVFAPARFQNLSNVLVSNSLRISPWFCARGNFSGSVSAGCVESAVVEAAGGVIGDGMAKLLNFGIADDQAWEVGLSCGGNIEIYVEKVE